MSGRRWVRLSVEQPRSTLCVLGSRLALDVLGAAPLDATEFDVCASPGVNLHVILDGEVTKIPSREPRWPLDASVELVAHMDMPSVDLSDEKVQISYFKDGGKTPIAKALLHLTCVEISLDADTNRSGSVSRRGKNKSHWTWGPDGKGAILLVNCDRDDSPEGGMDNQDLQVRSHKDLRDMSLMVLTTRGPDEAFDEHQLLLHVSPSDSSKVRVFHTPGKKLSQYKHILGSGPKKLLYQVERASGQEETIFYVEGLQFPDSGFSGLVSFHVTLLEAAGKAPIFKDSVVFRVAPWIMTPNTLQPITVYVCSVTKNDNFVQDPTKFTSKASDNDNFVQELNKLTSKAGCSLIVCSKEENQNDQWIQDEMEIGYVQAPHKSFPVVFDSPRNGGLSQYPFKSVLGPDFGYVTREPADEAVSSLDSFGNLEVSPPVTVQGKEYPLGRILIGSYFPRAESRKMAKVVRDFLYAQEVQHPVELYSDWLWVGHVDEFMSFVPAANRKGFRLLLASPSACYKLLKEKEKEGYGDAMMFDGLEKSRQKSISTILADKKLRDHNEYYQNCIDWNRDILKEELGLTEDDIIDIPQLFSAIEGKAEIYFPFVVRRLGLTMDDMDIPQLLSAMKAKAEAYFPDMVNMLVLGKYLGIPKPFGPIIQDECCLERAVRNLLEPLGLRCTFLNDFETYHLGWGEVHCGTNVRRKPFSFKWWNMIP